MNTSSGTDEYINNYSNYSNNSNFMVICDRFAFFETLDKLRS
ncbi:hypothetical protein [Anabaena sp. FACHB-1391]|nr:hypothetical protein [Anabaena sp. FACHB-1391]